MVTRPIEAKCDASMVTDKTNRQVLVRDVSTNLLAAEQRQKRGEGSNDGAKPTRGHPCRCGDHALLRYSELEKTFRMAVSEAHKAIRVFEVCSKSDDLVPLESQFIKRIRQDLQAWRRVKQLQQLPRAFTKPDLFRHDIPVISATASAASSGTRYPRCQPMSRSM